MKHNERTAPSQRAIVCFVNEKNHSRTMLAKSVARSTVVIPSGERGTIMAETPRIMRILKRQEPMTLPRAIDVRPFKAATALVASSGNDVPAPRIVMPMTASETPSVVASDVACPTNILLPTMSSARPTRILNDILRALS